MIILIKAGCFCELDSKDRMSTMRKFLTRNVYSPTEKLTMQQFNTVVEYDMIPEEMKHLVRIKNFKAYALHDSFFLKNIIIPDKKVPKKGYHDRYYALDEHGTEFLLKYFSSCIVGTRASGVIISEKEFIKESDCLLEPLKEYLLSAKTLDAYNRKKQKAIIANYASGTLEHWDMESLSYYPEHHELWNLQEDKYGVVNFNELPVTPLVYDYYTRRIKGELKHIPKFHIVRLAGTVLDSDNNKHMITLLTTHGVVLCKYNKGQYSYYNKRISELIPETDKKKVLEESWFKRGTKLLVCGYRRDDQFIVTKYADTVYTHTTNKINEIENSGEVLVQTERVREGVAS